MEVLQRSYPVVIEYIHVFQAKTLKTPVKTCAGIAVACAWKALLPCAHGGSGGCFEYYRGCGCRADPAVGREELCETGRAGLYNPDRARRAICRDLLCRSRYASLPSDRRGHAGAGGRTAGLYDAERRPMRQRSRTLASGSNEVRKSMRKKAAGRSPCQRNALPLLFNACYPYYIIRPEGL